MLSDAVDPRMGILNMCDESRSVRLHATKTWPMTTNTLDGIFNTKAKDQISSDFWHPAMIQDICGLPYQYEELASGFPQKFKTTIP